MGEDVGNVWQTTLSEDVGNIWQTTLSEDVGNACQTTWGGCSPEGLRKTFCFFGMYGIRSVDLGFLIQ